MKKRGGWTYIYNYQKLIDKCKRVKNSRKIGLELILLTIQF